MQLGTVVGGFALSALTLIASSARAAPVAIVNPGFETVSRTLADGEQTNAGDGTSAEGTTAERHFRSKIGLSP